MDAFLFRRFPKIPHGQVDIPGGKKTQHTRHARFAIDIALIVSLEVEGHEWSTCLRRLPGKELIKSLSVDQFASQSLSLNKRSNRMAST